MFAGIQASQATSVPGDAADPGATTKRSSVPIRRSSRVVAFTGGGGSTQPARMFIALKPLSERKDERRSGHRAPAAEVAHDPRREPVPAGGAGHPRRRPRQQRAVPVHAAGRRPRRAEPLGAAAGCSGSRTSRVIADVNADQQKRGLQAAWTSTATPRRGWASRAGAIDQALYDAFGQRQVSTMYAGMNSTASSWRWTPAVLAAPRDARRDLRRDATLAQLVPLSAVAHVRPIDDAARGQPPGAVPVDHAVVQPDAGRVARRRGDAIDGAARDIGMPATIHGSFPGTAQAFQESLANEPC